jgi:TPR repeat protein
MQIMLKYSMVVFFIAGCKLDKNEAVSKSQFGNSAFDVTSEKRDELIKLSDKGDAEAALRLARFYAYVKLNKHNAFYWYKRACGLGSSVACQEAELYK